MTATIEIELQQDLLEFLERYSQERKVRRDEIIAALSTNLRESPTSD